MSGNYTSKLTPAYLSLQTKGNDRADGHMVHVVLVVHESTNTCMHENKSGFSV
jgi:hypothetical protein